MSEAPEPVWTVVLEEGTSCTFDSDEELLAAFPEGDFAEVVARAVEVARVWDDPPVIPTATVHAAAAAADIAKVFFTNGFANLTPLCQTFSQTPTKVQATIPVILRAVPCGVTKVSPTQKFLPAPNGTVIELADHNWANRARSGKTF